MKADPDLKDICPVRDGSGYVGLSFPSLPRVSLEGNYSTIDSRL